jgi:1-acyl-sn-glycerol-3-phosphate acyltransferase
MKTFIKDNIEFAKRPIMPIVSKFFMKLRGWKIVGEVPKDVKKYIAVVAPHTSNWDFIVGMGAYFSSKINFNWLGKEEIFRFPFKKIMHWMGGTPVLRSKRTNMVDAIVQKFEENERLYIVITPEGTRSRVEKWKSGFYHIAMNAKIPILLTSIDFLKKEIKFGPLFHPTGNFEKDIEEIKQYFKQFVPKIPANFA